VTSDRHEDSTKWAARGRRARLSLSSSSTPRRNLRDSDSGGQIVTMMQTAEPWHRYNPATHNTGVTHCFTIRGRFLRQRKMRAIRVVITDVFIQQAFQMAFIHNDHMVEQIAAAIADPALGDTVLPRASEARPLGLDTEALYRVDHFFIELRAAIEDQITRRRVVRKCLAQLLDNPSACRVLGDTTLQDSPPIMRNDEEAVENAEGECRNGEEVHRGNRLTMVVQKSHPSLCRLRTSRSLSHPTQYGSLRNIEAQHLELSMNTWRAPGRILGNHAKDKVAQFPADALSSHAGSMPREPRPIQLESRPMPANNGLRLDDNQCRLPSRPKPPKHYPEHFFGSGKPRLRMPLLQDGKLLPKGQVLQKKVAARIARLNDQIEQELQRTEHELVVAEASRISNAHGVRLFPCPYSALSDRKQTRSIESPWPVNRRMFVSPGLA